MKTLKEIRVLRILDAITGEVEFIANNLNLIAVAIESKEIQPHKAIKMFRKLADRADLISKRDAAIFARYGKEFKLCNKAQKEQEHRIELYRYFFEN